MGTSRGRGEGAPEWRRLVFLLGLTFGVALGVTLLSQRVIQVLDLWPAFITVFVIILLGVAFDIVGVAATRAQEPPFRAMASKRLPGAGQSLHLIRNADRVSTVCCDVIGDIGGTVSGAAGIAILLLLAGRRGHGPLPAALGVAAIASLTVLGKAIGKRVAIREANVIIRHVGIALHWTGWLAGSRRENRKPRNRRST
ncbi:MAG: hypothetical protein RDU89_01015 [bacterium]|nr:hypothetical protein [bacterium]